MIPVLVRAAPGYEWLWFAAILAGAFLLRLAHKHWPAYADPLDSFFVVIWVTAVLSRLNLFFFNAAALPFHPSGLSLVAWAIFWAALLVVFPLVLRRWAGICLVLGASLLILKDIAFFESNCLLWSPSKASLSGHVFERLRTLIGEFQLNALTGLWAEALVVGLVLPFSTQNRVKTQPPFWRFMKGALFAGAVGALVLWLFWGLSHLYRNPTESSEASCINRWGIWNQHAFLSLQDIRTSYQKSRDQKFRDQKLEEVRQYQDHHRQPLRGAHFGIARGFNIILVQAESLQAFAVGSQVLGQPVTPFLDSLRNRSLYLTGIYSQSDDWDIDAQFMAMTSLPPPLPTGSIYLWKRDEPIHALPYMLGRQGYYALAASPTTPWPANQLNMLKRYGFQDILFQNDLGQVRPEEDAGQGMSDEVFFERMIPTLKRLPRPFIAYLKPGGPDRRLARPIPEHLRYLNLGLLDNSMLGKYLQGMRELDFALQELVEEVQRSPLRDNTLIVVYGSRAHIPLNLEIQAFLNIRRWDHASSLALSRIPLFIIGPQPALRGAHVALGGQMDIAPTLLSLLGIAPPSSFLGHSLLGASSPIVLQSGSVLSPRLGFRQSSTGSEDPACFDVPTGNPRPVAQCDSLRAFADQQAEIVRTIYRYSLVDELQKPGQAVEKK